MNPTLLTRQQIDSICWDAHVASSRQSVIYGFSWYLDIVCDDWNALVWPSAAAFEIVMPIPVKHKFGFPVVYQPHFCQYLGIFSLNELGAREAEAFLSAFSRHFSYISSYSFNPDNFEAIQQPLRSSLALKFHVHHTVWLSLGKSESDFYAIYSKDRKLNLRKSESYNWELSESANPEPLIRLFKENHSAGISGGVREKSFRILRRLFYNARFRKCAELWYAAQEEGIHAGVLIVKSGNRAIYIFNAADKIGRKGNGRTYLLDHYFRKNADRNQIFDFESPQVETIHSYYKSFGGDEVPFVTVSKTNLPFPLRQLQYIRRSYIKARQGLYAILCKI